MPNLHLRVHLSKVTFNAVRCSVFSEMQQLGFEIQLVPKSGHLMTLDTSQTPAKKDDRGEV